MAVKANSHQQFKLLDEQRLTEYITGLVWSNDGALAVITAGGELALWQDGKFDLLVTADNSSLSCVGFSHDAQYLAIAGQKGEVQIWRLNKAGSYELTATTQTGKAWIDSLRWHPTQNLLAYGINRQVAIWDADNQTEISRLDFVDSSIFALAWRPQGDLLAASGHGGAKIWQLEDLSKEPEILEVPGASLDCAWSVDGSYLASGNLDRTVSVLHWGDPPPWLMQGFPGKVSQVAWSSKGQKDFLAATCQEGIAVWQRKGDNWHQYVLNHEKSIKAIAFDRDFLLASAGADNYIQLWLGKKLVQSLKGASSGFSSVAWHPQGKYLAAGGNDGELLVWQRSNSGKGFG